MFGKFMTKLGGLIDWVRHETGPCLGHRDLYRRAAGGLVLRLSLSPID